MAEISKSDKITNKNLQTLNWNEELKLHPYQLDGTSWLLSCYNNGRGCILSDEMGLGKTCQVIAMLTVIKGRKKFKGPHLIACPRSVLENWKLEFQRFSPSVDVVIYTGDKEERVELARNVRDSYNKSEFDVLLTTYEMCLKDSSFLRSMSWDVLIVDEGHRLKNSESLLHQTLQEWDIRVHVLLTGTPVQNNLQELYSLLNLVDRSKFRLSGAEKFVEKYSSKCPDVKELHQLLAPYLLRRTKEMVMPDLPEKCDIILYHGLTSLQKKLYKAILVKDVGVFENAEKSNATILKNVLMQLRKCAIHPYLFNNVEPEPFILAEHLVEASQKMILLDHLLAFLKSGGHKVLIFSQMTRVLDIMQDYLGYRGYNYERLDGSVRGEERFLAVQNFNSNDETFVFLLSTKAGGQGLNLTSADTVIFIDSDFNPQNDLQAAARVHRIGQDRPVKIIRLIGRNTVEEIIMSRAEAKLKLTEKVIENGKFSLNSEDKNASRYAAKELQEILKFGLENLLAEDNLDENMDFEKILGSSENGRWNSSLKEEHDKKMSFEKELTIKDKKPESSDTDTAPQNIYIFEGRDYSHMPSAADITAFERLILAEKQLLQEEYCKTRSREGATSQGDISLIAPRRRMVKVLSPEEQEERLKKRQEQAEKMAQKQIEKQLKKALAKQRKRESIWRAHGYDSANIELKENENEDAEKSMLGNDTDDENNDETTANQSLTINYVSGDVTHPVDAKTDVNIMVMCADDSGKWGKGGLFSAMSARSKQPQAQYELAGEMKDLHLGHCHLISVNDSESRGKGIDLLALIIAQKRTKKSNVLSGIKFSALEKGLQKIHQVAKERKASVHLPRIGYDTPEFNWYGTERLIRKHLASKGIPTYIYYFPRKKATKRKHVLKTPKVSDVNTDTPSTDAKKQKIAKTENYSASPLPALFSGIAVHFYNLEDDVIKKLTRYVIAYDGDIEKKMNISTTHLITKAETNKLQLNDVVKNFQCRVVTPDWLLDSISKCRLLPTEDYLISLI